MNKYLGAYTFAPFAFVLALTFLFAMLVLPETQGTTPEELVVEMTTRKSKSVVYEVNEEGDGQMKDGTFGKSNIL
jgi:SP family facilitated glucose transporter-like MFS transporter 3